MISSDQEFSTPSFAPDWEALEKDVNCPLCDYNLRGLAEPRCPECGFQFDWLELLYAEQNRHPYLFEHQPKRNIWSFWKTFWADCRPRRFWRELSPVHVVRINRLLIYWLLANGILLLPVVLPLAKNGIAIVRLNSHMSHMFTPMPGGKS